MSAAGPQDTPAGGTTFPPGPLLFAAGLDAPPVEEYRAAVRAAIHEHVVPRVADAETTAAFPREAIAALGATGLFADRWSHGPHGDAGKGVVFGEELGYGGIGGIGVGISLHLEAVTSILRRFGKSEYLAGWAEGALSGEALGCVATSEQEVGSDLTAVAATATPQADGSWRVEGRKRFVSPGGAADFALVLCRRGDTASAAAGGVPPLVLALVPREGFDVSRRLETTGMRALETVSLEIDATVPAAAILGRRGDALLVGTWGLTHERLAIAAQVIGAARVALALATTRLKRRQQFGQRLFDHQALRLRLADLSSRVHVTRLAIYATAASLFTLRPAAVREVAAVKVTAAKLGEQVASECMHMFGGAGYLEDETPLARLARDIRVGRLGAGSDEVMWELVATGLQGDDESYERLVDSP